MYKFKIGDNQGFIELKLNAVIGFPDTTDFDGGYTVKGTISLQSGNYYVQDAEVWFTTGQIYELYIQLQKAYEQLNGVITFSNRDNTLNFELKFNHLGQIIVQGYFQKVLSDANRLDFEFILDQSYLPVAIADLKEVVEYYGDLKGVNNA